MSTLLAVTLAGCALARAAEPGIPKTVDFNRDVRPILSNVCFRCHGPDENQRATDFRLDRRDEALADLGGYRAIVPGDPKASVLVQRITSADPDYRMPPPDANVQLTAPQIQALTRWIEQGAPWEEHWAYVSPRRPRLPAMQDRTWRRNAIDDFVLARLEREGLRPSPQADKRTLIRRVTLDLTGLPPTPQEVDAFANDTATDAYDRLVERLLSSPRYGERMAMIWLDAARYADTSGYQNDGPRSMWRWRDWVIDAFNANMPYDQFTIQQIAGDLLPDATSEQVIATGFHRNHRGNSEGGIIPDEYLVEYVVDRVDTTFTVWLGLTIGCARCHDHKYDPISQREFYQLFAYFNNVPEHGRAIKEGNSPPYIVAPTPRQQAQLEQLDCELDAARERFLAIADQLAAEQAAWEATFRPDQPVQWFVHRGLLARFPLDGSVDQVARRKDTPSREIETRPSHSFTSGPIDQALLLDGSGPVELGDVGRFGYFDRFSLSAWIRPDSESGTIVSRMTPVPQGDGYSIHLEKGHLQVNLVKRWLDDAIRVETKRRLAPGHWYHLLVTYDGSRVADGIRLYVDGHREPLAVHLDALNQSFTSDQPLRIGGGHGNFCGAMDELLVYGRDLNGDEARLLATPDPIAQITVIGPEVRTDAQAAKLRAFYLDHYAAPHFRQAQQQLVELSDRRRTLADSIPTVMVLSELPQPRKAYVLVRGEYDKRAAEVSPGVPAVFPPLPPAAPNNRLGLARWLVQRNHPLTARVAVNRLWQLCFGTGLVATPEDFGVQGEPPTHPELLDWLAIEFVDSGWDVKALLKLLVTSATYRQASHVTSELQSRDPDNRLLARGPRYRLPAELIRDQALAVAGLLDVRLGGPSVKPYQPEGLWQEIATDTDYRQSQGADLYRRSVYTYWKRTVPPPNMVTFDATSRETCMVKRSRTNTPLQALVLMNDVTFVEAARVMAQRVIRARDANDRARIARAFQLATAREPSPAEQKVLLAALDEYTDRFRADPEAAQQLIGVGEFPADASLECTELAAFTTVCSLILNLDEVVTKE